METDEPGGSWSTGADVERSTLGAQLPTNGPSPTKPAPPGVKLPSDSPHPNRVNLQPSSVSVDDRFPSAGRGLWSRVPDADWNDWRWQLRNRITTLEALEALMPLTPAEREGVALTGH